MKHTFRKCLSLVLALATLLSVCVVPLTAATECNHYNYGYTEIGYQDPTCTEYGGLLVVCNECNERYVRRETWVDPLGHDWVKDEETYVAPTLTTDGGYYADCSRCGDRKWFDLKATKCEGGCDPENLKVVNTATCTEAGEKITTCQICGLETKEPAAALGHAWNNGEITQTPICGERDAIVTFTCLREGCNTGVDGAAAIYTVNEIAPVNHKWKWHAEDLGECGRNGNYAGYKCEYCDVWSRDGVTVENLIIVRPQHNWKVCDNADHAHEGTAFDGCHAGVVYLYCQNDICKKCVADNRVPTQEYTVGQSGNHVLVKRPDGTIYSANMTRTAATKCMKYATYSCTCGYVVTSEFPEDQKQHNWTWPQGMTGEVDPTCNTYGYKSCFDCGATEGYADINGEPIPGNEKYNKLNHIPKTYYGIMPEVGSEAFKALMNTLGAKYTEATCAAASYYEWNCPHAGCKYATVVNGGTGETYKFYVGNPNSHTTVVVPHKDATCTEDGVVGGTYCSACNIKSGLLVTKAEAEEVIPALGHTWENNSIVKDPAQGETKTTTESYWGKVDPNCSYAEHEGVLCGRCNQEQKNGPKRNFNTNNPANGKHVYVPGSSVELVTPATCTTPALLRYYCYVCNAEEETALNPGEIVGHDWQKDTTLKPVLRVPATCQNEGYDVYFCYDCETLCIGNKIQFTYEDHDRFISHFVFTGDATKDVSAVYDSTIQAWTFRLNPIGHDAIKAEYFDPTNANYGKVTLVYDAKTETFSVALDGVALKDIINAPEASADGKSNGYIGFDDPNTTELDGYNEAQNLGVCGIYSYYEWNCEKCGYRYNKHIEDQYGLTGEHAEVAVVDPMDCATAHTGKSGATECARCGNGLKAGVEVPVKHTIDKEAAGYKGKKAADCLTAGYDEYGVCTVCTQYVADHNGDVTGLVGDYTVDANGNVFRYNGWVAALGHKVGVAVEAQKVTCDLPGWDAHIKCERCAYVVDNATIDTTATTDDAKYANITWVAEMTAANGINNYKDPTDHNFTKNPSLVTMQCMKDGYIWYDCANENCSAVSVVSYKFGWAEHRYSDDAYLTDLECAESYCLCQNIVEVKLVVPANKTEYTLAECTIETAKCLNKNVVREADPHTNAAGEEILGIKDCAEWVKEQDHVCKYCKVNFINDKINHGNNLLTDRYNANCLDPKDYEHKSCTVCKQMWVKVVAVHDPAVEDLHDWSNTVAGTYVAPTWTTDGSRTPICALCSTKGTTVVIPAPDMFFDMSIDNIYDMKDEFGGNYTWNTDAAAYKKTAAMKVSKLANSSFVAVTIYATGSATNFTSINMSIPFDAEALSFAPGMTADKNDTLTIDGKTFVVDYNGTGSSVELFIHVENAKDGAPQNAELTNRTALITLYFQVNPDFYDVAVKNTISEATSLQFGDISVLEYDAEKNTPKQLTAIVTDTQAPVAGYPEVNGGAYVLTVYKLGDLNLNGTVTDFDAILVEEMAFATGYDAQADIDKDGDVDLVDFMYMKQYVIEAINYAELAAKVATDAE